MTGLVHLLTLSFSLHTVVHKQHAGLYMTVTANKLIVSLPRCSYAVTVRVCLTDSIYPSVCRNACIVTK